MAGLPAVAAAVIHTDEQAYERAVPGTVSPAFVRAHVEAYERADPGAVSPAFVRTHVEADAAADACGDDTYLRADAAAYCKMQRRVTNAPLRPDVSADAAAHGEP